jgi:hypothetical protein
MASYHAESDRESGGWCDDRDNLTALRQLGVIPTPPGGESS